MTEIPQVLSEAARSFLLPYPVKKGEFQLNYYSSDKEYALSGKDAVGIPLYSSGHHSVDNQVSQNRGTFFRSLIKVDEAGRPMQVYSMKLKTGLDDIFNEVGRALETKELMQKAEQVSLMALPLAAVIDEGVIEYHDGFRLDDLLDSSERIQFSFKEPASLFEYPDEIPIGAEFIDYFSYNTLGLPQKRVQFYQVPDVVNNADAFIPFEEETFLYNPEGMLALHAIQRHKSYGTTLNIRIPLHQIEDDHRRYVFVCNAATPVYKAQWDFLTINSIDGYMVTSGGTLLSYAKYEPEQYLHGYPQEYGSFLNNPACKIFKKPTYYPGSFYVPSLLPDNINIPRLISRDAIDDMLE